MVLFGKRSTCQPIGTRAQTRKCDQDGDGRVVVGQPGSIQVVRILTVVNVDVCVPSILHAIRNECVGHSLHDVFIDYEGKSHAHETPPRTTCSTRNTQSNLLLQW